MHKLLAAFCSVLAAFLATPALAAQGSLQLPLTGTYSGLTAAGDINTAFQAIYSCNSGATSPTNALGGTPVEGQCWFNTAPALDEFEMYDGSGWAVQSLIDGTNHVFWPPTGPIQTTAGTSTALTLTTNYAPFALVDGSPVSFIAGTTNGANPTLQVNSLGSPAAIQTNIGTAAAAGSLVAGSVYTVTWNAANSVWLLSDVYAASAVTGIVPTGAEFTFSGFTAPSGYFIENGQAVSRTTYVTLLGVLTTQVTGNRTSGQATITGISSTVDLSPGWAVEGTGIPASTTILSINSSSQITLSNNASSGSGTSTVLTLYPHGNGDGSTTFNIPDYRGYTPVGQDDMGTTAANVGQLTMTLTTTGSSTAASVGSATGLAIGMYVDSVNTAAGTTISTISGTSITLSQNATNGGAVTARFSPVYDAEGVGKTGGALTHIQDITELVSHTHTATVTDPGHNHSMGQITGSSNTTTGAGSLGHSGGNTGYSYTGITVANSNTGGGNPMLIFAPSKVTKFIIKF